MGVGFFDDRNTGSTAWMFKTDANGVVGWDTSTPLGSPEVKVYPNPASIRADLLFGSPLEAAAVLNIYNVTGELLKRNQLKKGTIKFAMNLQDFTPGVYFYEVLGTAGAVAKGRFVKE
jgi:hypothetical protein